MSALIRAAGLSGYESLAAELGIDGRRALRRVGLAADALRDPDGLIPYAAVVRLLEQSADEASCRDFGLRLAQRQGIEILGPLSVAIAHAATLREALATAEAYMFVHSDAIRLPIEVVADDDALTDIGLVIDGPNPPNPPNPQPGPQAVEQSLGVIVRVLAELSQGQLQPTLVLLPHAPISARAVYRAAFGCPSRFEQGRAAVRIPTTVLSYPLEGHDALLRSMAQSYLDTHFVRPHHSLADRVRILLKARLGTEHSSQEQIARVLAMHPRTLQRRLRDEGVNFQSLKDEVRRDLLRQLLSQPAAPPLGQIAAMLEYSEQSALTRSCRRWFGAAPSDLLKQRH